MASDKELIEKYLTAYNELLYAIEIFGLRYPNNAEGYNFLIEIASKKRDVAMGIGLTDIAPLPDRK
jgi:hypothetical protein